MNSWIYVLIKTIYNLKFGFRQNLSISNALINVTEDVKALDRGNIDHEIVDLQKVFEIVDQDIFKIYTLWIMIWEAFHITGWL